MTAKSTKTTRTKTQNAKTKTDAKSTKTAAKATKAPPTEARRSPRRTPGGRSAPGRRPPATSTSSRWLVRLAVAVIAVAALAAVVVSGLGGGDDGGDTATTPFDRAGAAVEGTALAPLPEGGPDPAVGQPAPVIEGQTRDGSSRRLPATGRPTVLLFLAHWCPHCQREVPAVQEWVDTDRMPGGVDVVAVSTAVDPSRPNFPASAWLDREGWSLPTVADADGTAAAAYGLTGFPFWVAVDDQGVVVERRSGELTLDQLRDLAATATAASDPS